MLLVRVELFEADPSQEFPSGTRILSMADGSDITRHVRDITIHPGLKAIAYVYKCDENGEHYYDPELDCIAYQLARIVSIKGEWKSR